MSAISLVSFIIITIAAIHLDVCLGQSWLITAKTKEEARLKIQGLRSALVRAMIQRKLLSIAHLGDRMSSLESQW